MTFNIKGVTGYHICQW